MQTPQQMNTVLEKLRRLPPERVMEVEDFIDFLSGRDQERRLVRATLAVSEASLKTLWDNSDDAAYDRL